MELNIYSVAAIIGVAGAVVGGAFALGKLFEKVNQLEKSVDKLESSAPDNKKTDALSILDEKYAKGNITTEEYEERKKKLQDN